MPGHTPKEKRKKKKKQSVNDPLDWTAYFKGFRQFGSGSKRLAFHRAKKIIKLGDLLSYGPR